MYVREHCFKRARSHSQIQAAACWGLGLGCGKRRLRGVIARSKLLLAGGADSDVEREDYVECLPEELEDRFTNNATGRCT